MYLRRRGSIPETRTGLDAYGAVRWAEWLDLNCGPRSFQLAQPLETLEGMPMI